MLTRCNPAVTPGSARTARTPMHCIARATSCCITRRVPKSTSSQGVIRTAGGTAARNARPAMRPRNSRANAVQVVAFRDHHRAELITSTAKEFCAAWTKAICCGPDQDIMNSLDQLCDQSITLTATHPLGGASTKGLDSIKSKLAADYKSRYANNKPQDMRSTPVLVAANDAMDVAFCLLEMPPSDLEKDTNCSPSYELLKLDMMVDDGARRVMAVTERAVLAGGIGVEEREKQAQQMAKLRTERGTCAMPFPKDMVQSWSAAGKGASGSEPQSERARGAPAPDLVQEAESTLKAWCAAKSSAENQKKMLKQAIGDGSFQMYDAYGIMPLLCDTERKGEPAGCDMGLDRLTNLLNATKEAYDVKCTLVESAVCLESAAGFCHWKATQKNKESGQESEVDAMEVNVFDPATARLRAVYLFRDAMQGEELELIGKNMKSTGTQQQGGKGGESGPKVEGSNSVKA